MNKQHWANTNGEPLCGAYSDEVTRLRDYYEEQERFCSDCAELLDKSLHKTLVVPTTGRVKMSQSKHELLYEKALQAINDLFDDTSVPQSQTAESLKALQEEIDNMLDTFESSVVD